MNPHAGRASALPADIRTAWQRLGEPAALSFPVALIYLPFAFAGPVFIDPRRLGGDLGSWVVVALAGWLALAAVFWLARRALMPLRRGRALATVAAIALAVVVRAATLTLTAQGLGLTLAGEFAYRFNAAIFTQSALLIASAIVVSSYVHHGRLAADLRDRQSELAQLSARSRERLARLRGEISTQVRRAVEPIVAQLDEFSAQAGASGDGLQSAIQRIVDDELRPLSQRLADVASLPASDVGLEGVTRISRPPMPERVPLGMLFRPLSTGLLAALLAASQAIRAENPIDGFLFTLTLSFSVALSVSVLRRVVRWVSVRWWIGLLLVTISVGVLFALIVLLWERSSLPMQPNLEWAAFYSGLFIGALPALEYLFNERRVVTEDQLRQSVTQLQAQSSMLRQHEFIASRQLSYVVHGSVQTALNAAAMRLTMAEIPDRRVLADICADIDEAINRIDASGSAYVMLVETLTDLVELWEGTAEVSWVMDHRTVRVLAESPPTAASVGEIVTECVSNAIRHGRARTVKNRIEAVGDTVEVTVVDDGSGLPVSIEPRLGTTMLDEVCLSWERFSSETGTTVRAVLSTERVLLPTGAM